MRSCGAVCRASWDPCRSLRRRWSGWRSCWTPPSAAWCPSPGAAPAHSAVATRWWHKVRVLYLDQIKLFGTSYSRMIALQSEAKSGHLNFEISIVSIIISYLHILTSEDPVMRILKIERWGGQWILNVSSKVHKIPNIFASLYTVRKYLQPSNVLSWVHMGGIKYPAGF